MTESELKAEVVALAHLLGWRVFSLAIARQSRPVKDASGYPDLTLARGKRVHFIELKTADGVLSQAQHLWMGDLPGYLVIRPADLGALAHVLA